MSKTFSSSASHSAKLKFGLSKLNEQNKEHTEDLGNSELRDIKLSHSTMSPKMRTKSKLGKIFGNKKEFVNNLEDNIVKKVLVPEILRTGTIKAV